MRIWSIMISTINKNRHKNKSFIIFLVLSFIVPSAIVVIAYALNKIWPGSEKLVLISDLRALNFPLSASLRYVLSGNATIFYQTYSLLGSGNISTYMSSYSGLFSWLMGMFPLKMLPDVMYFIEVFETGICGLTCFLYFRFGHIRSHFLTNSFEDNTANRFLKKLPDLFAVVFSVLYATCSYNMVYFVNMPWMNITISLPIILLGIDKIIESKFNKNKTTIKAFLSIDIKIDLILILSFAYSLYSCYYITFASGIFGLIYFALRMIDEFKKEEFAKKLFGSVYECGVSVILGTGLVMPLLFPTLLSLNKSNVYLSGYSSADMGLFLKNPLKLLSMFLPGADVIISDGNGQPFIYCGVFSLILFVAFILLPGVKARQKIATLCVLAFFIMSLSVFPLYMLWHGFRTPNWHPGRFTYTFVLFIIITAYKSCCIISRRISDKNSNNINMEKMGIGIIVIPIVIIYVFIEALLNTSDVFMRLNINYMYDSRSKYEMVADDAIAFTKNMKEEKTDGRVLNSTFFTHNDSALFGYNGFGYFCSTFNQFGAGAFYKLGTMTGYNYSNDIGFTPIVMDLFGYRYIKNNRGEEDYLENGLGIDKSIVDGEDLFIRNDDALSIGYVVSERCKEEQGSMGTDELNNQNLVLSDLCGMDIEVFKEIDYSVTEEICDDNIKKTDIVFNPINDNGIWLFIEDYFYEEEIDKDKKEILVSVDGKEARYTFDAGQYTCAVFLGKFELNNDVTVHIESYYPIGKVHVEECNSEELKRALSLLNDEMMDVSYYKKGKLVGDINVKEDGVIFFSIPYEEGYKLYIDGELHKLDLYRNVFLCSDITEGEHEIRLVFHTPGLFFGLIVFFATVIIIIFLLIYQSYINHYRIKRDALVNK